jgi:hypothetical protein
VVNQDDTVRIANRTLQIEKSQWRNTLAKCHVLVCEHLDGTWSVFYGPHRVGRYAADGSRYRQAESSFPESGNPAPPRGIPALHRLTGGRKQRYYNRTDHVLIEPDISMC